MIPEACHSYGETVESEVAGEVSLTAEIPHSVWRHLASSSIFTTL